MDWIDVSEALAQRQEAKTSELIAKFSELEMLWACEEMINQIRRRMTAGATTVDDIDKLKDEAGRRNEIERRVMEWGP